MKILLNFVTYIKYLQSNLGVRLTFHVQIMCYNHLKVLTTLLNSTFWISNSKSVWCYKGRHTFFGKPKANSGGIHSIMQVTSLHSTTIYWFIEQACMPYLTHNIVYMQNVNAALLCTFGSSQLLREIHPQQLPSVQPYLLCTSYIQQISWLAYHNVAHVPLL